MSMHARASELQFLHAQMLPVHFLLHVWLLNMPHGTEQYQLDAVNIVSKGLAQDLLHPNLLSSITFAFVFATTVNENNKMWTRAPKLVVS
jgi:hypothetical protein